MIKRIISLFAAVTCFAGLTFTVSAAPKLNLEYDFESFKPDDVFSTPAGGSKISWDESGYLEIPVGTVQTNAPNLNVNFGQNFTLEFDAKNTGGQQSIIKAEFEGVGYLDFFTILADGRGPILRNVDNSPMFWYSQSDAKPNQAEWNTYRIEFDYATKTVNAYVNDEPIEKFYDRSYSVVPAIFPGTKLLNLKFYLDPSKTSGSACYDNIKLYTGTSESLSFTDDFYKSAYLKLNTLEAVTDTVSAYPMEKNLTRGEFTELVMAMLGMNVPTVGVQSFADVPITHSQFSAINMATMMGFVSKSESFRPDEKIKLSEAVTIICNINGYNKMADINGGWPTGYMNAAYENDILKNITIREERQLVNVKDAFILLENALTAPMMKITLTGVGEATYSEDENETILYRYHGLKEIQGNIEKFDDVSKKVTFTEKKTGNSYVASYNVNVADIEDTVQNIWIDKEYENISYMYPVKDSAVVYGYITEVNSSEQDKEYNVGEIKRIAATNCIRTPLSDDAEITLNGEKEAQAISPIGMYARLVISKGNIVKADLYDLTDGGIIESASAEKIVYSSGVWGYSALEDIDEEKPVKVILNNSLSDIKSLKKDTYFDYIWLDGGLTVIASDNKAEGILKNVSPDRISVETEKGSVFLENDSSRLYISAEGEEDFSTEYSLSSYLNKNVKIYADAAGVAKYAKAGESDWFYGAVVRYDDECNETEYPTLTVSKLGTDGVSEGIYQVKIKSDVIYYPEVGYYDVLSNCKKTDGSGIYKFYEKNGIIRKIEAVEWYNGGEVSLGDKFDYRAVRVYTNGSWKGINKDRIFLLENGRGEFAPEKVEWSNLTNKWASGAKVLIAKAEPVSPLMIITEHENAVYQDAIQFGFVEKIEEYYGDVDEEMHTKYTVVKQNAVSTLDLYSEDSLKYSGKTLGRFDFMMYAPGSLNTYKSGMVLKGIINLGEEWVEKTSGSIKLVHMGTYIGDTNGYIKTSLNGEEKYMLKDTAGFPVYEVNSEHTKFTKVLQNNMIGKDLWVISIGDIVRGVFFEK